MPRPGWTSAAEVQWLEDHIPKFRLAQDGGTIADFKKVLWQDYFDHFHPDLKLTGADAENMTAVPLLDPTKGPEDGKPVTVKKRKGQLITWFYNHNTGQKGEKEGGADKGFNFAAKKPGKIHPYQAYWTMYPDEVSTKARALAVTHQAKVAAGEEEPRDSNSMFSFSIEAAKVLLAGASDEVKAAVEEYRGKHKASDLTGLDVFLDPDADPGVAERQKRAKKIQSAIEGLPKVLGDLMDQIDKQIGWTGTIMVGGPRPDTGKLTAIFLHSGRTHNLGYDFGEATENWPAIQAAFNKFMTSCFPADVAKRLTDSYHGVQPASSTPSPPCPSLPGSLTSAAPLADVRATPATMLASGLDGPDMSIPPSQAMSEPTVSTAAVPASTDTGNSSLSEPELERQVGPSTTRKDKDKAQPPSAMSYDEARTARIEANQKMMGQLGLDKLAQAIRAKPPRARTGTGGAKKPAQAPTQGPTRMTRSQAAPPTTSTPTTPPDPVLPSANSSDASGAPAIIDCTTITASLAPGGGTTALESAPQNPGHPTDTKNAGNTLGTSVLQAGSSSSIVLPVTSGSPALSQDTRGASDSSAASESQLESQCLSSNMPLPPLASSATSALLASSMVPHTLTSNASVPSRVASAPLLSAPMPGMPLPHLASESSCTGSSSVQDSLIHDNLHAHGGSPWPVPTPNEHTPAPFTIINNDTPDYITDALRFFSCIEGGGDTFRELVELWQVFELCMGYPGNSLKRDDRLPTEGRPEAIAQWMKAQRSYNKLPEITSETLGPAWMEWWTSMQPACRRNGSSESGGWALRRAEPEDHAEWNRLWKGGPNGLFLALISLAWWLWSASENDEPLEEVLGAVSDMVWVLQLAVQMFGAGEKRANEDTHSSGSSKRARLE